MVAVEGVLYLVFLGFATGYACAWWGGARRRR